jgi:hypothetical protein
MWPPRRSNRAVVDLQRANETLAIKLLKANSELRSKTLYAQRLEHLVHERSERVDELSAKLEQSREQVRRLGLENELLAAMIAPPVQTAEITSSQSQAPTAEIPR